MTKLAGAILLFMMMGLTHADDTDDMSQPIDFTLPQLHGKDVSLSEFRGSWLVLNYWATWCAPCRKEIPELSELNDDREDITVLGLAFEDTDTGSFDEFLEEFKPSYRILLVDVYEPRSSQRYPEGNHVTLCNPDPILMSRRPAPPFGITSYCAILRSVAETISNPPGKD